MRGSSRTSLVTTMVPWRRSRKESAVALDEEATCSRGRALLGTARASSTSASDLSSRVGRRSAGSMCQLPGRGRRVGCSVLDGCRLLKQEPVGRPDQSEQDPDMAEVERLVVGGEDEVGDHGAGEPGRAPAATGLLLRRLSQQTARPLQHYGAEGEQAEQP